MASIKKAAIHGGFGAGVGASLAMMVVMGILRLTTNTTSIPELMEEKLTHLAGGQLESYLINNLGVGGKALLLTSIVEGTLILGGLLGLAFSHLWLRGVGFRVTRWLSGLLYGLVVGLVLNAIFLPLVDQGFFGANALQVTAPPDIAQSLYHNSLAPIGLATWLNMFVLGAIFGLALVALLKWPRTVPAGGEAALETTGRGVDRRDFTRAIGGGILALAGGGVLWAGITRALQAPPNAGLVEVDVNNLPGTQPTSVAGGQVPTPSGVQATAVAPSVVPAGPSPSVPTGASPQPTDLPTGSAPTATNGTGGPTQGATQAPASGSTPTTGATPPAQANAVPPGFQNVKAVLVPATTPVADFYITTKNYIDPVVDGNSWKLTFSGMMDNPYSITLKDLQAMPSQVRQETLACISNPTGGNLIGNATWKGVKFADLLNKAKPQQGIVDVVVRAADGYADSFPLAVGLNNDCMLAYEMNGQPLTNKHGYPARLLVPNIYGMKNCKWITDVQFVNTDFKGFWQSQGWDDTAIYQTLSRIDYPNQGSIPAQPIYVGGIAFAGNRGIKKVEVSTDAGKTWSAAQIRIVPGPNSWVLWTYPWNPKPGNYTLQVRATDGKGALQTAQQSDTYPNGATGYHTRSVQVTAGPGGNSPSRPVATLASNSAPGRSWNNQYTPQQTKPR